MSETRKLIKSAEGTGLFAVDSLVEAQNGESFYLVMDGDYGGQIYLSCAVEMINCDEQILPQVLQIIDNNQWPGNDSEGAGLYYEKIIAPAIIEGGMGGGLALVNDVWVNDNFLNVKALLKDLITEKLSENDINQKIKTLQEALGNEL